MLSKAVSGQRHNILYISNLAKLNGLTTLLPQS